MNMRKLISFVLIIISFFCLVNINPSTVLAAETKGLQVKPLRSRPVQNPGDTTSGEITVTNQTDKTMDVSLSVERFKVTDEEYNYNFQPGEHTYWVRLADSKVSLTSNQSKKIAYSLAVPNNASPGGYYFAIIASTENNTESVSFKEVKRVASLIYLEVSGLTEKKVNLLGIDAPWFLTKRSISIDARLNNQGNTHVQSRILYFIKPIVGKGPDRVQAEGLILPSTIRKLHTKISVPFWPGIYKLKADFSPPQGGNQNITQTVIYMPIWSWLLLILIASLLFRIIRSRKKFKNR